MSKILLISVIALAIAGVMTGVFEVKVNTEKFSGVSSSVQTFFSDKDFVSNVQYYAITWKRKAELAVAGDTDKKFEVQMKHVEADTKALQAAIDASKSPAIVVLKSRLLDESLKNAKGAAEEISDDAIARVRDAWLKVLASANQQLQRLAGVAGEYEKYKQELENLAPALQGEARPDGRPSPSIDPTPSPTPVPLKF